MSSPQYTSLPSIRELLPEQFDVPSANRHPLPPLAIPSAPRSLSTQHASPTQFHPSPSQYPSPTSPFVGGGLPSYRPSARRNTIASINAPYPALYSRSPTSPLRRARSPPAVSSGRWPSPPTNTVQLDPRIVLDPSGTLPSPPPTSRPGFATFRLSPTPPSSATIALPPSSFSTSHHHYPFAAARADIEMRFYDPHGGPPEDPGSSSDTSSPERTHGILVGDWDPAHSASGVRAPRRRRHEEERRHECARCHKRFSRPSSLRIHENTHTGHKPFECPQSGCGRVFSVNSNMRRHYRTHLGTSATGPLSPNSSGVVNAYPRIGDEEEDMSGSSEEEDR